jgi:tetratricopeptide (TPR) repeat protein
MTTRVLQVWVGVLASLVWVTGCRTAAPGGHNAGVDAKSAVSEARRAGAHAHYAQGVLEELSGHTEASLEQYQQAAELDPGNEELVVQVARRWLLRGKPERALDILKLGVAEPGSTAMLDVLLGTAYAQSGQTNLAVQANERAIKKAPHLLAGYQNLYTSQLQTGHAAEAMQVLDDAARQKSASADFLVSLSDLYLNLATAAPSTRTNAQVRALGLLERAGSMSITNVHTRLRLADGFNSVGKPERAAELYQALLVDYPQMPEFQDQLRAKLTDIYLRGKDRQKAVAQLEAIAKEDPLNMQAQYYLALLASEANDPARAVEHFSRVVSLQPKFEQAYYDLAIAQLSAGQTNEVFATLELIEKRFGQTFVSEFLHGAASARVEKFEEAVRRYTSAEIIARATDAKRLTPSFYFQMGSAQERKGDYSGAVKSLEKALELKSDFPEAANYLGYMWAERGENLERAKALIDLAVKAEPKNSAYLDSLAWVLFKMGKAREALPVQLQAVEIANADKEPDAALYDHLGDIYQATGDLKNARAAWRKALDMGPNEDIRKKLDAATNP